MSANTPEALAERCLELERLLREKDDELSAVRKALLYGADDALWSPGQSMGDVVELLVSTRTYFEWCKDGDDYRLLRTDMDGSHFAGMILRCANGKFRYHIFRPTEERYETAEAARAAMVMDICQNLNHLYAKIIPPLP